MQDTAQTIGKPATQVESTYAWVRLWTSVLLGTIGSVGMWAGVVTLPAVQADFGVGRADASLPYTLTMIGFGLGAVAIGRFVDRFGVVAPLIVAVLLLGLAFVASAVAPSILVYALASMAIGVGSSATFAPLIADISHWFARRRGIAVSVCASGNYIGGAIWPPIVQHLTDTVGWRQNQIVIGLVCLATMLPLTLVLLRRLRNHEESDAGAAATSATTSLGLHPRVLFALLCLAGGSCCVAMSMPQVHIVAYCGDLGYGVARGAEMLSLMLGFGVVSRIASGWIADRVGGIKTLLLGSTLQCVALVFYLIDDSLNSLYLASAMFGLFQGGIVPSYALIVREYFPPKEAGFRVGLAISSTLVGMALGGWMGGVLFDMTGSYRAAFINGIAWNLLNGAVAWWLLFRQNRRNVYAA